MCRAESNIVPVNGLGSDEKDEKDVDLTPTEEKAPTPGPAPVALDSAGFISTSDSDNEDIIAVSHIKVKNYLNHTDILRRTSIEKKPLNFIFLPNFTRLLIRFILTMLLVFCI